VSPESVNAAFVGVEKTYDGRSNVVSGLDLSIQRGEFLTLLGPSGSGKTTILMMLAGFEAPTGGEIFLNGRSLSNVPPYARNMGVVFQNYALFPHMSVAENLAFPLVQRRMRRGDIREKVAQALRMVELAAMGERRPHQLSGGQQQRVALARALVFEPELVLMDEPLGALDRKLREQMQLEIRHLHDELGMTVVYVTHDQGEALTMSDRIAIFSHGAIQQIDAPGRIYEHPCNSFVANFIGDNNRIDGTVVSVQGQSCTVRLHNGAEVQALPIRVSQPGEATTLSIRPEHIAIFPDAERTPNRFEASVIELIYHGDHIRVRMNLAGHDDFMARTSTDLARQHLQPGETVTVGWATEHCRALDPT